MSQVYEERFGDIVAILFEDHVATVTIDRPPSNFFDAPVIADIATALEKLDADPRCRSVVLQSEGRHFCAGAALSPNAGPRPVNQRHVYDEATRILATGKPIVAAVQGAAIGGGLGLALFADFRVGTPETRCATAFARLGFHHGFGMTVMLPEVVGAQRALDLLLTGRRVDGVEAHELGLLDSLTDVENLRAEAHRKALDIAECAPLAVRSIRATMRGDLAARVTRTLEHERSEQNRLFETDDFVEGVRASAERRVPRFEGK